MEDIFMEIYKNEKNENTALILMLSIINKNLIKIINILDNNITKTCQLSPEDYME